MQRNAIVAFSVLIILCMQPIFAKTTKTIAQPKVAPKIEQKIEKKFTYCEVRDFPTGGKSGRIWVSQIFEFEYVLGDDGSGYMNRINELATEFYSQVVSMGGAGDKSCMPMANTLEELTAARNEQRIRETKRVFLWSTKWTDVTFTPKAWSPTIAGTLPSSSEKFMFCYGSDMSVARRSVSSDVISVVMPAISSDGAYYTMLASFQLQFQQKILATYLPSEQNGLCEVKDTYAEARHRLDTLRKLLGGRLTPWNVVNWSPEKPAIAAGAAVPPSAQKVTKPDAVKPEAPKPEAPKPVVLETKKPAAYLSSPVGIPVYETVFGSCNHYGTQSNKFVHVMTPVFQSNNPGKLTKPAYEADIANLFKLSNDPQKKMKKGSYSACYTAGTQMEAELLRSNLLHAYTYASQSSSRINIAPTPINWAPVAYGGSISAAPSGQVPAMFIGCSLADQDGKILWMASAIKLMAEDAGLQLGKVQRINSDYQTYISINHKPANAGPARCFAASTIEETESRLSAELVSLQTLGFAGKNVKWMP